MTEVDTGNRGRRVQEEKGDLEKQYHLKEGALKWWPIADPLTSLVQASGHSSSIYSQQAPPFLSLPCPQQQEVH